MDDSHTATSAASTSTATPQDSPYEMGTIEGELLSHAPTEMVLRTSSSRQVTVRTPYDMVTRFNQTRSGDYSGTQIKNGDTISIMYAHQKNTSSTTMIPSDRVQQVMVLLELISKSDSINKF